MADSRRCYSENREEKRMSEKLKPCPFRVHGERTASWTVAGEYYYNETFMPCMGEKCAAYWNGRCMRDGANFPMLEGEEDE